MLFGSDQQLDPRGGQVGKQVERAGLGSCLVPIDGEIDPEVAALERIEVGAGTGDLPPVEVEGARVAIPVRQATGGFDVVAMGRNRLREQATCIRAID